MPSSTLHPNPLAPLAAGLRSGQIDLAGYVEELLDRIAAVEPQVRAFVPEAGRRQRLMDAAAALLQRYPEPKARPPLFGVPVGVKDIFHVDGFATHAGSRLPAADLAGPEAASVRVLRAAGALVLGKTVTTEFAYFEPGPTRNPHHLGHTPGGSSSGSAAAVAAGMAPLALGTQTIGSVIRPAAFCGIVGYKPSYDRIDPTGLLFFSRSADHVGLFTQDVAGAALAASVLCRNWLPAQRTSSPVLGVPEGPYLQQASAETLAVFEQQLRQLQAAGVEVVRAPLFAAIAAINRRHRRLIAHEFAAEHAHLFARHEALYRPRTAALIREGQSIPEAEATGIRAAQAEERAAVMAAMSAGNIDLWVTPAAPGPAPAGIDSTGDPAMNLPWSYTGLPSLTLPGARAADGLPLGLQLVGRWQADERLLAWGEALQPLLA